MLILNLNLNCGHVRRPQFLVYKMYSPEHAYVTKIGEKHERISRKTEAWNKEKKEREGGMGKVGRQKIMVANEFF